MTLSQVPPAQQQRRMHAIRTWLLAVAGVVFILVLVGGATRLTESGLSIVEWKPVLGTLPPLDQAAWESEFEKYKQIPQYRELNRGMSLEEFKTIYWWEWSHRFLGRLVGVVFLIPFLFFLWRGWVGPGLRWRLWFIFALGGAQGAVGWWMVASGLAGRVSVSQYRLAFHLTLACVIFAALLWTAQRLTPRPANASPALRGGALALLIGVLVQIYLGALVAGLDAGMVYNTWPQIDGGFIPDSTRLFFEVPLWRNFFENPLTVQFVHRMMAYALWIGALLHAAQAARNAVARPGAVALALATTGQAAIGIMTLLAQAPISLALAHQGMAVIVLTLAVIHAARLAPPVVTASPALRPSPVGAHQ